MQTDRVVEVEASTHDGLKAGVTCSRRSFVLVHAGSPEEACLVAAQVVAAQGWVPTRTRIVNDC